MLSPTDAGSGNTEDLSVITGKITFDSWDEVIDILLKLSQGDIWAVNGLDWRELRFQDERRSATGDLAA
ncbi:hypothetical protein [Streptomyces sp. NPDC088725]|uniref:hypothetical protein n=1 Tax=Streptomyces sp. NPDC088725 TaxID=3365873 RepID=UPI00382797EA